MQLLEYDKRFEQYGSDFTFYDYNQPEELPSELKQAFQVVVADPPYLVRHCFNTLIMPYKDTILLLLSVLSTNSHFIMISLLIYSFIKFLLRTSAMFLVSGLCILLKALVQDIHQMKPSILFELHIRFEI